ncbi:predicted protein [Postia placenta Mad-698-R]|nr:predicted protein [Postia placenta Mad-698-R]
MSLSCSARHMIGAPCKKKNQSVTSVDQDAYYRTLAWQIVHLSVSTHLGSNTYAPRVTEFIQTAHPYTPVGVTGNAVSGMSSIQFSPYRHSSNRPAVTGRETVDQARYYSNSDLIECVDEWAGGFFCNLDETLARQDSSLHRSLTPFHEKLDRYTGWRNPPATTNSENNIPNVEWLFLSTQSIRLLFRALDRSRVLGVCMTLTLSQDDLTREEVDKEPMRVQTDFIMSNTGPLAGFTVRTELKELQKADLGRKYGLKDRRPLDPPPVVQLQIFRVHNPGTSQETEEEIVYTSKETGPESMEWSNDDDPSSVSRPPHSDDQAGLASLMETESPVDNSIQPFHRFNPPYAGPSSVSASTAWQLSVLEAESSSTHLSTRPQTHLGDRNVVSPADDLAPTRSGTYPESMTSNEILCGSQTVSPTCTDYVGKKALLFVFSDLAVKSEGTFALRYRAFDILSSIPTGRGHVAIAECSGGRFRIYSTKDFPGLRASTSLTKSFLPVSILVYRCISRPGALFDMSVHAIGISELKHAFSSHDSDAEENRLVAARSMSTVQPDGGGEDRIEGIAGGVSMYQGLRNTSLNRCEGSESLWTVGRRRTKAEDRSLGPSQKRFTAFRLWPLSCGASNRLYDNHRTIALNDPVLTETSALGRPSMREGKLEVGQASWVTERHSCTAYKKGRNSEALKGSTWELTVGLVLCRSIAKWELPSFMYEPGALDAARSCYALASWAQTAQGGTHWHAYTNAFVKRYSLLIYDTNVDGQTRRQEDATKLVIHMRSEALEQVA